MSHLSIKYCPQTQKNLFNKEAVNIIKKWIQLIQESERKHAPSPTSLQKILYVSGPSGCGKTASLNLLFKSFDIYEINASELRSSEKIQEIAQYTKNSGSMSLANIEK